MRRRSLSSLAAAGVVLTLTGCGSTAGVEPGPTASAPLCAEVLRVLPEELSGAERRSTNSQATAAWGDPAIALRCGVSPPGPTTDRCISVTGADGTQVDWVMTPLGEAAEDTWQFTTYGQVPAIEVTVPVDYAGDDATTTLVDLGAAVALTDQQRTCV
ncbi:DUF3515 family protein [Ruania zhangjianzhongii]|uniref:DUF3515 family protein n=1 Tax=Ruania zhangjianzhongii TaxID=2603206 RepID=UPI0011CBE9CD|nr:DUF3515 family protein [Ruania zhangjianzhongii]